MPRAKPKLDSSYPPRGMRADRAAAYLDMSLSSFHRLVEDGTIPAGVPIKGMVVWDRRDLDDAFDDLKSGKGQPRNSMDEALGINTDEADGS